jgi:hypothetical protein
MAERTKTSTEAPQPAEAKAAQASIDTLQAQVDEAEQQGYYGTTPDDTPNRNYTVAGVTEGAPTS